MPEAVIVWAVQLRSGLTHERKGTLSLEVDALAFAADDGSGRVRIAFEAVRKARRLRGSPVLLVTHDLDGRTERTAFYFAQPPPLEAPAGDRLERPSPLAFGRGGRRKARRQNVGYLGTWNRELKAAVAEWEQAVREGVRGSEGEPG